MPIIKTPFGSHENITVAEFGTGDIKFVPCRFEEETTQQMILFYNQSPARGIGETDTEWAGKCVNDLPPPEFVLRFNKPESITALIQSLLDIQLQMLKEPNIPVVG